MFHAAILAALCPSLAWANPVTSTDTAVLVGRVVGFANIATKDDLVVNVVVHDLGGSTDLAPTQQVWFTMYRKGDMFSTDASFRIGEFHGFVSAKRVSDGTYELVVKDFVEGWMIDVTYAVDARNALAALQKLDCGDDMDCDASTNFQSTIDVVRK